MTKKQITREKTLTTTFFLTAGAGIHSNFSGGLGDNSGLQFNTPLANLIPNAQAINDNGALQISAVWACVNLIASTIAGLPLKILSGPNGDLNELERQELQRLLEHPNEQMTSFDFWMCMAMNRILRGNAFAKITRSASGTIVALTPLAATQVRVAIVDGDLVYEYVKDADITVLKSDKIFHWRGLGNGIVGLSQLDFMRATTTELKNAQLNATDTFGNGRQLTGLLTVDQDLNAKQIEKIKQRFKNVGAVQGAADDWLKVLPADMKWQQISMSPSDTQLLETRQFGVDEIGRWFGVPSALINGSGGASGSNVDQARETFYSDTIAPYCTAIEQTLRWSLLPPDKRANCLFKFELNALLRASVSTRYDSYGKALQNGFMTRNEVRALENLPEMFQDGADKLTAQNNLVPLEKLGQASPSQTPQTSIEEPIKQ